MSLIRNATQSDVPMMVTLLEQKRTDYAKYQPLFWRKAQGSIEKQSGYFEYLLQQDNMIMLVHETEDNLDGFIIAGLASTPPVYDIGGLNCIIDDFCVSNENTWSTVGEALLDEASHLASERGVVQIVVVTGYHHEAKRKFLTEMGLSLASEWYTKGISPP